MEDFLHEADPERAWGLFLEECLPTVERATRRATPDEEEASDLAAEVLRRIKLDWPELLGRYQQSRSRAQAGFRVWLAVVARNSAIDVLRERHGRAMLPRPVARMPRWKQRLWKLVLVEGRALSEAADELAREGLWSGELSSLAAAAEEVRAAAPRISRLWNPPRIRAVGSGADGEDGGAAEPATTADEEPSAIVDRRTAHAALRETLADLGPDERLLLRTYFLEGTTAVQVAHAAGLRSANQVYDQVKELMRRLRAGVEACGLGPEDLGDLADFDWRESLPRAEEAFP